MNDCLADANVAGRDALVEAQQAGCLVYSSNATAERHFVGRIVVELQSRFHKPDGIGGGGGGESGARCAQDVYDRRVGREMSGLEKEL